MFESNSVIKSACLVLNGEVNSYEIFSKSIKNNKYDFIVAVDGGANHLYNVEILPDVIVGDLDSISDEVKDFFFRRGVEFKKYPSKKNETDSELAIISAVDNGCKKIDLLASLGGRIDHQLANVNLLHYIHKRGCKARILNDYEEMYIVENEDIYINGNKDDNISIIPAIGDAIGVTLENLEYPLHNFDLEFASPRGISNVMLSDCCKVSVRKGCLIVVKTSKSKI